MANLSSACDYLAHPSDGFGGALRKIKELKMPESGDVLTPFVNVTFNAGDKVITVGNNSTPGDEQAGNHACVHDFEFGQDNGMVCRVGIHDEQGGSFERFMNSTLKDIRQAIDGVGDGSLMEVQFGWIKQSCGGESMQNMSPVFYMYMREVYCNFRGGKFMFEITGVDLMEPSFEARSDSVFGGDLNPMYFTDAVTSLLTNTKCPPSVKSVRFLQRGKGKDTAPVPLRFKHPDPVTAFDALAIATGVPTAKGPKAKWEAKNLSKIAAVREWMSRVRSEDDKGLTIQYNSEYPGGEVIIWEDWKPKSNEWVDWGSQSLGTYVVNGGSKSCVLEFNPQVKWNFYTLPEGGGVGNMMTLATKDGGKNPGLPDSPNMQRDVVCNLGSQTSSAGDDHMDQTYNKQAGPERNKNIAVHLKANNTYHAISADLVVVGDPRLPRPSLGIRRNLHVVFLNPYYIFERRIFNAKIPGAGDWLADPPCNNVLTNRAWMVQNINHRISDGKFVTTLRIFLAAPGVDLDPGSSKGFLGRIGCTPVGGLNSGGWIPPCI